VRNREKIEWRFRGTKKTFTNTQHRSPWQTSENKQPTTQKGENPRITIANIVAVAEYDGDATRF
jgi:hypothetical protein